MIVKIYTQDLKPGMHISNPGLSSENNPHIFLSETDITTEEQVIALQQSKFVEVFIDTEKGDYFKMNPQEKLRLETPFTIVSTNNPYEVNTSANFDDITNAINDAEKYYFELLEYVKTFTSRISDARNIALEDCQEFTNSIISHAGAFGNALIFLSKLKKYDEYSYTHNLNVAMFSILFGQYIGLGQNNLMVLGLSGLFHDIGKILIPERILKKPQKLTAAEYAEIKRHPTHSRDMLLRQKNIPADVIRTVYEHHEQFSGGGYPQGLRYNQIGRASSLISIVDTFDALTTDRCYSKALHAHKALSIIFNLRGSSFSPVLVDRFVKFIGVYPVGSIVVLSNGNKGVVIEQNQDNLLLPKIRVMLNKDNRYRKPKDIDLIRENASASPLTIVGCMSHQECRIPVSEFVPQLKNSRQISANS
ncbi:MAG: HD-GYP domain-containing protein [Acidobacteriota bacterium]